MIRINIWRYIFFLTSMSTRFTIYMGQNFVIPTSFPFLLFTNYWFKKWPLSRYTQKVVYQKYYLPIFWYTSINTTILAHIKLRFFVSVKRNGTQDIRIHCTECRVHLYSITSWLDTFLKILKQEIYKTSSQMRLSCKVEHTFSRHICRSKCEWACNNFKRDSTYKKSTAINFTLHFILAKLNTMTSWPLICIQSSISAYSIFLIANFDINMK